MLDRQTDSMTPILQIDNMSEALRRVQVHMAERESLLIGLRGRGRFPAT